MNRRHMDRKVILYIAMSIDGFIAGKNDELDFLKQVETTGEDYGYAQFIETIDTVIMGRKTYDIVLSFGVGFPHEDKKCYILTRVSRATEANVTFYNDKINTLIDDLKKTDGKNIFIDGGAEVVHLLLKNQLIDELIISIIPVLLGDGIRLFKGEEPWQKLELISAKSFEKGLVQLHYSAIK